MSSVSQVVEPQVSQVSSQASQAVGGCADITWIAYIHVPRIDRASNSESVCRCGSVCISGGFCCGRWC